MQSHAIVSYLDISAIGVCIIDDDRLIDHIDDLENAFIAWQVCSFLCVAIRVGNNLYNLFEGPTP